MPDQPHGDEAFPLAEMTKPELRTEVERLRGALRRSQEQATQAEAALTRVREWANAALEVRDDKWNEDYWIATRHAANDVLAALQSEKERGRTDE